MHLEPLELLRVLAILLALVILTFTLLCMPAWRAASRTVRLLLNALLVGVLATALISLDLLLRAVPVGASAFLILLFHSFALWAVISLWGAQYRARWTRRKDPS